MIFMEVAVGELVQQLAPPLRVLTHTERLLKLANLPTYVTASSAVSGLSYISVHHNTPNMYLVTGLMRTRLHPRQEAVLRLWDFVGASF